MDTKSKGDKDMTGIKPSEFFANCEWANKETLEHADSLGVRFNKIGEKTRVSIEMPLVKEGHGVSALVEGYGSYTVLEMIATAYAKGISSKKAPKEKKR